MDEQNVVRTLKKKFTETGILTLFGEDYEYWVIERNLEPRLPNFAGLSAGMLFISDEVPVEYRPFVLAHEVLCNVKYKGEQGRCERALREELARVPDHLLKGYVDFRKRFFRALVEFNKDSPNEDFKQEIAASLRYLESL